MPSMVNGGILSLVDGWLQLFRNYAVTLSVSKDYLASLCIFCPIAESLGYGKISAFSD